MAQVFLGAGWVETSDGALGGTLSGRLSGRERALFEMLAARRDQVVTYAELAIAVWGDAHNDVRRLKVLVQRLRQKVEPSPAEPEFILTVHRQGYRLAPDTVQAAPPQRPSLDPPPGSPAPAPPVDADLPTLFGRAAEQAHLEEWLLRRRGPWLTLTGVGGVGKSTLLEWAHARGRAAGLPCWWVSLRDIVTLESALERIAERGRIQLPPHIEPAPVLAAALRGREGLWLLDDLTALEPAAQAGLDRLFAPLSRVRVLASSRHPLQSLDEAVLPVSPLSAEAAATMYHSLADDGASMPERVPLLPLWIKLAATSGGQVAAHRMTEAGLVEAAIARARAPAALSQLGWHPGETRGDILAALLEISKDDLWAWRSDGLVEIHADGRVRVHPVIRSALRARAARADRMGEGPRRQLDRLIGYVQGQAARDFEHVPKRVRRQLMPYLDLLLEWIRSVRPAQIDAVFGALPMLVQVIIGSGRERSWIETLSQLAERLDLRQQLRPAARLRLAAAALTDRLSPADEHLRHLLEIRREALDPSDQDLLDLHLAVGYLLVGEQTAAEAMLGRFDDRVDTLRADLLVRYRLARASSLRRIGSYHASIDEARAAVAQVRTAAPLLETQALLGLTSAMQDAGLTDEVWPAMDEAERAAERWDDHAALATCLRQKAQHAMIARQTGRALEHAERALALTYPGSASYVYALYTAAILNRQHGAVARSLALLDQALAEAHEHRVPALINLILDSQGNALLRQGDVAGALDRYAQAIEASLAQGDHRSVRRIHSNVAYAHLIGGDLASALRHQELGRDHEDMPLSWKAFWAWRQAAILFARGQPEEAVDHLRRAADDAKALRSIDLACESAALAASWLFEVGERERALAIGEAISLSPDAGPLLRRLPLPLREAVQRPAQPDLVATLDRVQAALTDPGLTRGIAAKVV